MELIDHALRLILSLASDDRFTVRRYVADRDTRRIWGILPQMHGHGMPSAAQVAQLSTVGMMSGRKLNDHQKLSRRRRWSNDAAHEHVTIGVD
jgi:hypothetical protein